MCCGLRLIEFVDPTALLISVPYLVALGCALVEHALETWFVPRLKDQTYISYIGLGMIILGEVTRKLAVVTASRNFTHEIKVDWRSDHQLVTHGIYRCVSVISQPFLILFWSSSFLYGEACKSKPIVWRIYKSSCIHLHYALRILPLVAISISILGEIVL